MHLRTNENEVERSAAAPVRDEQQDRSAELAAADTRALTAVGAGAGAVASMDAGAARSLQRMAGNAAMATVLQRKAADHDELDGSGVGDALTRSGSALSSSTQERLAGGFGQDASNVQLIRDDASTTGVQAKAYTSGSKIVVPSSFDEHSEDGQRTLAHEFTHVQQQAAGPVDGTPAAGGVSVSDPGDRFEVEAEANADRVMGGGAAEVAAAGITQSTAQASAQRMALQRQGAAPEEEEQVQALRVQRQGAAPEEEEQVQALRVQRQEAEGPEQDEAQTA